MAWNSGLTGTPLSIAEYQGTPLRIMAGPGTGKTFSTIRRIARLLEYGVRPKSILAVTFTRAAASDLVYQLSQLGSPGAPDVVSSTLHSFCFGLLSRSAVFQATTRVARPLLGYERECLVADLAPAFGVQLVRSTWPTR